VRSFLLLAMFLSPGLAPLVLADAPSAGKTPGASIEPLIEQLGNPDYRKRDRAAQQLEAEGTKILPELRKAMGHPDAEVRRRVADLIPKIELAAILAPKRVSLKVSAKTLKEICDEIGKQTGYKIESWPGDPKKAYTFDFENLTFWEAIDRVCQASGLGVQQSYGDTIVRLQPHEAQSPFVYYEGAFRFVATSFQHFRQVDFAPPGRGQPQAVRSESLTLSFTVYAEPKLPFLGMGEVRLTAAYDSDKNSMLVATGGGTDVDMMGNGMMRGRFISRYNGGYRALAAPTEVRLNRPSEKATAAKIIRGSIPVTLLSEEKAVVVADDILKAKGKKTKVGNTSFSFEDVTELANTKQLQIKVTITEDNKENPNDYTWMNTMYQRIELLDAKGNKYQVNGTNWHNNGPNFVQMTWTYALPPNVAKVEGPAKFIFHQWTTLPHQVSFEFKDLPLP
jgi:hypothetical protein